MYNHLSFPLENLFQVSTSFATSYVVNEIQLTLIFKSSANEIQFTVSFKPLTSKGTMCLIVDWVYTCGCAGEGDFPNLCEEAIAETKGKTVGPTVGTKCRKLTRIWKMNGPCPHHEMDEVHKAHVRNFVHAVVPAALCFGLPCNCGIHARSVGWSHQAIYELCEVPVGRHELMVSIDAVVNLHLGFLKPEQVEKVQTAVSDCWDFNNDGRIIQWALKQFARGKDAGVDHAEIIAKVREEFKTSGATFEIIGRKN